MYRRPETNRNKQSYKTSKFHFMKSEVREVIASKILDIPELSKEVADSQICLHMMKLLKIIGYTFHPLSYNHISSAQ